MAKYNERYGRNSDKVEADSIFDLIAYVLYGLVIGFPLGLYFNNIVMGLTIGVGIMIFLLMIDSFRKMRKKRR